MNLRYKKVCTECWGSGRVRACAWNAEGKKVEERDLGVCPACKGVGHHGYQEYEVCSHPFVDEELPSVAVVG